ncbi:YciI family protein [Amycolatopsis sp. NBC_01488]|uniref:YciI family protein n=1 Tax=Amycolatopsis sp. NBC_01488 TaxID=2903563 RepID=UPI002E2A4F3C|nr:YciI family protein [Amycolatopsis sp. NBC_01488]
MKQYLLAVQFDESAPPEPEDAVRAMMARTGKVTDEMKSAGAWVFVGGLQHSDASTVVRTAGGKTAFTDGPFAETKEQLGGFWVIQVEDLDKALAWAEKCSIACGQPIEVRPFDDGSRRR